MVFSRKLCRSSWRLFIVLAIVCAITGCKSVEFVGDMANDECLSEVSVGSVVMCPLVVALSPFIVVLHWSRGPSLVTLEECVAMGGTPEPGTGGPFGVCREY